MSTDDAGPRSNTPRPNLIIQFARFWSSNMDLIHSQKQSWPGFSYTDDEKAEMHRVATAMSRTEFYTAMFLTVVFTIIIAAACIGIMFWRLNTKYGADPSKTPAAVFFFYLASASIATLAGGIPFSILLATGITSKALTAAPDSIPDESWAEQIFRKATHQIVRMGAIMCSACLVYWIFVPTGSKLDLLVHVIAPMLGPVIVVLSVISWLANRITTSSRPTDEQNLSRSPGKV